jgi:hypothetical protein
MTIAVASTYPPCDTVERPIDSPEQSAAVELEASDLDNGPEDLEKKTGVSHTVPEQFICLRTAQFVLYTGGLVRNRSPE